MILVRRLYIGWLVIILSTVMMTMTIDDLYLQATHSRCGSVAPQRYRRNAQRSVRSADQSPLASPAIRFGANALFRRRLRRRRVAASPLLSAAPYCHCIFEIRLLPKPKSTRHRIGDRVGRPLVSTDAATDRDRRRHPLKTTVSRKALVLRATD